MIFPFNDIAQLSILCSRSVDTARRKMESLGRSWVVALILLCDVTKVGQSTDTQADGVNTHTEYIKYKSSLNEYVSSW